MNLPPRAKLTNLVTEPRRKSVARSLLPPMKTTLQSILTNAETAADKANGATRYDLLNIAAQVREAIGQANAIHSLADKGRATLGKAAWGVPGAYNALKQISELTEGGA